MLRQQLQQHLRNQSHAMRGFGDYLRRNLAAIAEFALFSPPLQREQPAATQGSGLQPQPSIPQPNMTAAEVDSMQFLMQPTKQQQGVLCVCACVTSGISFYLPPRPHAKECRGRGEWERSTHTYSHTHIHTYNHLCGACLWWHAGMPLSSLVPGLKAGNSVPLDVVASALRALWIEENVGGGAAPGFDCAQDHVLFLDRRVVGRGVCVYVCVCVRACVRASV
eukprot:1139889-Pelagomonas_calceolata.AAC.2